MITTIERAKSLALDIKILKSHLRIEHDFEDSYLKILVETATDIIEKKIGISITEKTYKFTGNPEHIPIRNVSSIVSSNDHETIFIGGINNSADLQYAILQISKNMYECNDENILESQYIKHIVNSYKNIKLM